MALDAGATGEHPPHRAAVSNALLLLALGLVALVVSPIWKSLLFAAILATVLAPLPARRQICEYGAGRNRTSVMLETVSTSV
jgi:hypothetical protein